MDYLPKDATIEQACNWLQAKTGQTWILPRLLECHLTPHFWLDYKQGYPAVYGNRIEGYQTCMMFQGDLCRLESDGAEALVNMFAAHDGSLIKTEPGLRVPLSELRFKRDQVERVAEIINNTAPAQSPATPAPVVAASDGPAKPQSNKSEKTLIFEAKVIELMGKFWNERTPGTEPTKGDLSKLVYLEILRTGTRGKRKTTQSMVNDAAKPWKFPLVLPTFVRESQFNEKRHPFKGDR